MIFADKLIDLRKKNGWTQEDLAERLAVSRQTISKWEGAQSVPDFKRMIQLSELFHVSTDYLLKDSVEADPLAPAETEALAVDIGEGESLRPVSMETADAFLTARERAAGRTSVGVLMCILSPVLLVAFSAFEDVAASQGGFLGSELSYGLGVVVLLIIVAGAVAIFIRDDMLLKEYEYMENESLETAYGVSGMVSDRKARYQPQHVTYMVIGVLLCVLSPIPPIAGSFVFDGGRMPSGLELSVLGMSFTLIMIAIGVMFIVRTNMIMDSCHMLLEEGEFSRANKAEKRRNSHIYSIYWAAVIALFLLISFLTGRWDRTWIIWPVAGVLCGLLSAVLHVIQKPVR